ncbi:MAG TPA: hypothetical protein DDW51_05610 [Cyanobacteria bacterium UBA11367]|nr:hypothetical protein [Cyanobacteria bacterium UBA11367]HBE56760.1 hypothetical protein [Cyanobacteria bacterium UBA11366]HCA95208.1 hypothetical protein [Cyanobacteria bacterium UBA9226]
MGFRDHKLIQVGQGKMPSDSPLVWDEESVESNFQLVRCFAQFASRFYKKSATLYIFTFNNPNDLKLSAEFIPGSKIRFMEQAEAEKYWEKFSIIVKNYLSEEQ